MQPALAGYKNTPLFSFIAFATDHSERNCNSCNLHKLLYRHLQHRFLSTKIGAPPDTNGKSLFIRSIISLEFIITFVLVSNLIMISKQTRFAMDQQLGAGQHDAIHLHSLHRSIVDQFGLFKERMLENPNVVMVTASMEEPTGQAMDACEFEIDGVDEGEKQLFLFPVDQDFFRFYDIDLLYGTDIPGDYNPDDSAEFFFLNETAAKMISDNPESLIGKKPHASICLPGFYMAGTHYRELWKTFTFPVWITRSRPWSSFQNTPGCFVSQSCTMAIHQHLSSI